MNDYRGLLIKKERKKQDISLEALAYGICSPSYLSKIENNILIDISKIGDSNDGSTKRRSHRSFAETFLSVLYGIKFKGAQDHWWIAWI